jgi:hypothetical protein
MVDLGTLGGTVSEGYASNSSGQVAGRSETSATFATMSSSQFGTKDGITRFGDPSPDSI